MATKTEVIPNWAPLLTLTLLVGAGLFGVFGLSGSSEATSDLASGNPELADDRASETQGSEQAEAAEASATPPAAAASAETEDALPSDVPLPTRGVTLELKPGQTLPDEVKARHVLVQYKGSWKRDPGDTLLREAAKQRAEEALKVLRGGEAFDKVLAKYCNNSTVRDEHGVLPPLQQSSTMTAIANAVFPLKAGEYSAVTESVFGYHVFQRTK